MPTKEKDAKKAARKAAKVTDKTHLLILVDETGSMSGKEEAVVSGVNEFIARFQKADAPVRASIAWFDECADEPRTRFKVSAKPVSKVKPLSAKDYSPRGMTPLNDAILDVLKRAEKHGTKDEGVFVVILTDGLENASEADSETVAKAIKKAEKKGWGFLFLGANQNADVTAQRIGLKKKGTSLTFNATKAGTNNALRSAGGHALNYASAGQDAYLATAASAHASIGGKLKDDEELDISS